MQQQLISSLAALEAYSQAHDDFDHGRRTEAIPLFQQAIALDPSFAAAQSDLATVYWNLHQGDLAAITSAYSLRDTVGPRERLAIEARYHSYVTGDVIEQLRVYRAWTAPIQLPAAWASPTRRARLRHAPAIEDARRALALGPDTETNYVVLLRIAACRPPR